MRAHMQATHFASKKPFVRDHVQFRAQIKKVHLLFVAQTCQVAVALLGQDKIEKTLLVMHVKCGFWKCSIVPGDCCVMQSTCSIARLIRLQPQPSPVQQSEVAIAAFNAELQQEKHRFLAVLS